VTDTRGSSWAKVSSTRGAAAALARHEVGDASGNGSGAAPTSMPVGVRAFANAGRQRLHQRLGRIRWLPSLGSCGGPPALGGRAGVGGRATGGLH
jgi:hypothetical protein